MSDQSSIEWTDATWNPTVGCTRVSEGCDHCYIVRTPPFRMSGRDFSKPGPGGTTGVLLHPDRLDRPLWWTKPRRVFVNSLSDLFHREVHDDFVAHVFATMAVTRRHTYQVLTKRPARAKALLSNDEFRAAVAEHATDIIGCTPSHRRQAIEVGSDLGWTAQRCDDSNVWTPPWPLPNVWLGTSVETQRWANIRVPLLLDTPAAVRFLSCEPLLGPVQLASDWLSPRAHVCGPARRDADATTTAALSTIFRAAVRYHARQTGEPAQGFVDWVIVGGESGPDARPMEPDWARGLRDRCAQAGVPFFLKQWGGPTAKAGGRELDGRTHDELPGAVTFDA